MIPFAFPCSSPEVTQANCASQTIYGLFRPVPAAVPANLYGLVAKLENNSLFFPVHPRQTPIRNQGF